MSYKYQCQASCEFSLFDTQFSFLLFFFSIQANQLLFIELNIDVVCVELYYSIFFACCCLLAITVQCMFACLLIFRIQYVFRHSTQPLYSAFIIIIIVLSDWDRIWLVCDRKKLRKWWWLRSNIYKQQSNMVQTKQLNADLLCVCWVCWTGEGKRKRARTEVAFQILCVHLTASQQIESSKSLSVILFKQPENGKLDGHLFLPFYYLLLLLPKDYTPPPLHSTFSSAWF